MIVIINHRMVLTILHTQTLTNTHWLSSHDFHCLFGLDLVGPFIHHPITLTAGDSSVSHVIPVKAQERQCVQYLSISSIKAPPVSLRWFLAPASRPLGERCPWTHLFARIGPLSPPGWQETSRSSTLGFSAQNLTKIMLTFINQWYVRQPQFSSVCLHIHTIKNHCVDKLSFLAYIYRKWVSCISIYII